MSTVRVKYYDTHTLYVTSGVAREEQLYRALKTAIKTGEDKLNNEMLANLLIKNGNKDFDNLHIHDTPYSDMSISNQNAILRSAIRYLGYEEPQEIILDCDVKVNLIVNKNGEYYGFGYIRVSNESVYWMLLGRNPDGSDRILEYPDPEWTPPSPKADLLSIEEGDKYNGMSWYEIAQEEDKYIHPIIKEDLGPLMVIPGYEYDELQYKHLQEIAIEDGKDPSKVPRMGYFEFARAYGRDVEDGKIANVLCARQVPDWIPHIAFKNIFKPYVSNVPQSNTQGVTQENNQETKEEHAEEYPIISITGGKKEPGKIVFITFDPNTKDAIFSLLMTRKVRIIHPKNPDLKATLIFDHAYEHGKTPDFNKTKNKGTLNKNKNNLSKNKYITKK